MLSSWGEQAWDMGCISQLRLACPNTVFDRISSKIGTPAERTKDVCHYVNLEGFLQYFEKTFSCLMNCAVGQQTNYSEEQGKVIQKMIWLFSKDSNSL